MYVGGVCLLHIKLQNFLVSFFCVCILVSCTIEPEPISEADFAKRAVEDLAVLFEGQEPLEAPLSLSEAIARAIRYNLDHRVSLMEKAVNDLSLDTISYDLLPNIVANAGYTRRNNDSGSSSQSLITGQESLGVSKSQDRVNRDGNLEFSWNILDFGVSYFRAKQQADLALVSEERRRKVIQNIVQDVQYAYWRAFAAQKLVDEVDEVILVAEDALKDVRKVEEARLQDPISSLGYQKVLLETIRDLTSLKWQLKLAKIELAALINIHPNQSFELLPMPEDQLKTPNMSVSIDKLEDYAVIHRPEIREEDYQQRVSKNEIVKEYLSALPGISVNETANWNQNRFLFNNRWMETGVSVAWNLIDLVSLPDRVELAETRELVVKARRLAVTMAVLSQVNISYRRLSQAQEEYEYASELESVEGRILKETESAQKSDLKNRLEYVQSYASALLSQLRKSLSFAELQNAASNIYISVGADLLPRNINNRQLSITELSHTISQKLDVFNQGNFMEDVLFAGQQGKEPVGEKVDSAVVQNPESLPEVNPQFVDAQKDEKVVVDDQVEVSDMPVAAKLEPEKTVEEEVSERIKVEKKENLTIKDIIKAFNTRPVDPAPIVSSIQEKQDLSSSNKMIDVPGYTPIFNNGKAVVYKKDKVDDLSAGNLPSLSSVSGLSKETAPPSDPSQHAEQGTVNPQKGQAALTLYKQKNLLNLIKRKYFPNSVYNDAAAPVESNDNVQAE